MQFFLLMHPFFQGEPVSKEIDNTWYYAWTGLYLYSLHSRLPLTTYQYLSGRNVLIKCQNTHNVIVTT